VYPGDPETRFWRGQLKYVAILESPDGDGLAELQANTDAECIKVIDEMEHRNAML
jgi:hypothetical protein